METVARELESARAITVAIAFADVALYSGNLEGADALARRFIEVARSPELRALCHIQLAHLALARGKQDSAREELAQAQRLDHAWGLETRGLLATLPFAPATETELRRLREEFAAWDAAAVAPSTFLIFAMHNDLHPTIREYLLGLIAVRLGDLVGAGAHSAELARMATGEGGLPDCLSAELGASIARAVGKTGEALAILERSRPRLWFQLTVASPFFSLASRRFLQAELLREAGRYDEAAGWYDSIAQRSPYELVYAAAARERLAGMRKLSS
jgi:tetratricopeptide (TPR) repeat protein